MDDDDNYLHAHDSPPEGVEVLHPAAGVAPDADLFKSQGVLSPNVAARLQVGGGGRGGGGGGSACVGGGGGAGCLCVCGQGGLVCVGRAECCGGVTRDWVVVVAVVAPGVCDRGAERWGADVSGLVCVFK